MRILFTGTSELGIPSLEALCRRGRHEVRVLTKPDQRGGRGRKEIRAPLKEAALRLGLPVEEPDDINGAAALERVKELAPDIMVVASYHARLSGALLGIPRFGGVNIHPSLLPKYRGAAPIQHAILHGDSITGVTVFQLRRKMDAGEILGQVEAEIAPRDNYLTLHDRLARAAAPLLLRVLDALEQGTSKAWPQDDSKATLAPKVRKEDGAVNWQRSACEIDRQVRAYHPWPGAYAFCRGGDGEAVRIQITAAEPVEAGEAPRPEHARRAGEVVGASGGRIVVACGGGGCLAVLRLQRQGKKEMDAAAFLRGMPLPQGSLFS